MAQSSFKMKIVGTAARLLHAIPVIRPQDLATKGLGSLQYSSSDGQIILGKDTQFTQQVQPRDLLTVNKTILLQVEQVISDTEIRLKVPLDKDTLAIFDQYPEGVPYKVTPHVDQAQLFEKVHERLAEGGSIVIFPEGGSHDRTELLPLKAGFAIMALGAMAEKENVNVQIVPVGLNYFHPHRFRSRAVVSYGTPIKVNQNLVEKYKQGGTAKREAISTLLNEGYDGLKSVTVNAPNYDTLMIMAAARRLYKPAATHKLSIDQVVDLNRRFLLGYRFFKDDPTYKELENKVKAYNNHLKYFGLSDHQVERTETNLYSAAPVLIGRLIKLIIFALLGFPALIINSPLFIVARIITLKKQKEALAGSSVKIAARDVLATWKVIVALVFTPLLYGFYSSVLFGYLWEFNQLGWKQSLWYSMLAFIIQPFFAYMGLRLVETGLELLKSIQPLILAVQQPNAAASLRMMREKLSDDVTDFVNKNGPTVLDDFDQHRFDHLESKKKASTATAESWNWTGIFDTRRIEVLQHWFDDKSLFNLSPSSDDEDD
ncbi:uncharacterized protein BX664DRAFT_263761 [Halteromyces radiatus]|uniref:uncharacterized protein n=1 Tax=Halteromyces radiatus TaxID=101107 RepID=UPI0022206243|nr:uncharacterized protein BX664DRAFT_263761 [Halteromyces radiatus]KAI8089151.1 hypothetical protein BX664DRAFT_263761 [Halteromyces radiatus]